MAELAERQAQRQQELIQARPPRPPTWMRPSPQPVPSAPDAWLPPPAVASASPAWRPTKATLERTVLTAPR